MSTLEATCKELRVHRIDRTSAIPVVEFQLRSQVGNARWTDCHQWDIASSLRNCPPQLVVPGVNSAKGKPDGLDLGGSVFPTLVRNKDVYFGIAMEPGVRKSDLIQSVLNITCSFRAVSESSMGVEQTIRLGDVAAFDWLRHDIDEALAAAKVEDE